MRTLTDQEKRTVRLGAAAVVIYLVLFFGYRIWRSFDTGRSDYKTMTAEAQGLRQKLIPYETKVLLASNLMAQFQMDPAKLSKMTVVAEASAAIQKAAASGGVQLGPIRESPGRSSSKELVSMQLEGTGQIASVMSLLHRFSSLGYPLILDSVQITAAQNGQPGMVKLSVTLIILDYDQWKSEETPNA